MDELAHAAGQLDEERAPQQPRDAREHVEQQTRRRPRRQHLAELRHGEQVIRARPANEPHQHPREAGTQPGKAARAPRRPAAAALHLARAHNEHAALRFRSDLIQRLRPATRQLPALKHVLAGG